MESDRRDAANTSCEAVFPVSDRNVGQSIQEIRHRHLPAALDIRPGVAMHRHNLLSRNGGNARAGDDDLFELDSLLSSSLFVLFFYRRRARSLSLIHLSQAKSVPEAFLALLLRIVGR